MTRKIKHDFVGETLGDFIVLEYLTAGKWNIECTKCKNTRIVLTGSINRSDRNTVKFLCKCNPEKYIREDLRGKTFGKLTVVNSVPIRKNKKNNVYWECKCSCGNPKTVYVRGSHLTSRNIKSCGCLVEERVPNQYFFHESYIECKTNKGIFIFDYVDYEKIYPYHWYEQGLGYVTAQVLDVGIYDRILFHRFIMNPSESQVVDHINGDVSDNRRSNLRVVDHTDNQLNRHKSKRNKSGKIGVSKIANGKWQANIRYKGISYFLGRFETVESAIQARINKEKELLGDSRICNIIKTS